jgi:hypothetical protein
LFPVVASAAVHLKKASATCDFLGLSPVSEIRTAGQRNGNESCEQAPPKSCAPQASHRICYRLNIATDVAPASTPPWGKCICASSDHIESRCETCANDHFRQVSCRPNGTAKPARCSCARDFDYRDTVVVPSSYQASGLSSSARLSNRIVLS